MELDHAATSVEEAEIPAWAPKLERFSRADLEDAWPRVLTVESALFASGAHKVT